MDKKDIRIIVGTVVLFVLLLILSIVAKVVSNDWSGFIIMGIVFGGLIPFSALIWLINLIDNKKTMEAIKNEKTI